MIENKNMYMVLFMNLPPFFDNLVTSLESMSTKDVDFQFIIFDCFMRFPREKKMKVWKMPHKANKKVCFHCKKSRHFLRNCLKRKNDEKEKANQACED
jgi:hypothetical protein